jgi:hypothetical protein
VPTTEEECQTYTFHIFTLEMPCADEHGHLWAELGRIVAYGGTVPQNLDSSGGRRKSWNTGVVE